MAFGRRGRSGLGRRDRAVVASAMQRAADEGLELQRRILLVMTGQAVSWSDEGHERSGTPTGRLIGAGSGILTGQAQFLTPSGEELWAWPARVAATGRLVSTGQTVIEAMRALATFEAGAELLDEVIARMGMDRAWTAEEGSDVLWWPSPLAQRLDFLTDGQDVRLSATTDLIRISPAQLAPEGADTIESLLSDVNYRFGSRSAWWFDPDDAMVRATTSVVVRPRGNDGATQLLAASAVLQAWEAMNVLSLIGDAAPDLGMPCLSEHPTRGARSEPDAVMRMVQRDLHEQQAAAPPPNALGHLAGLSLWSSCVAEAGRIAASPVGCEGALVSIWVEAGHATFGGGVYFEAQPAMPALGVEGRQMAGVLNRLAVLDLSASLGGAWSVNEGQDLVYRSFWPATFAAHPSVLAETAGEVVVQCARAEGILRS